MTMMTQSDRLLEDIYDLISRQKDEQQRLELARIGKLAIEYRANQIKRQRMQRAIEQRAEERKALTGASRIEPQRAGDDPFRRDGA